MSAPDLLPDDAPKLAAAVLLSAHDAVTRAEAHLDAAYQLAPRTTAEAWAEVEDVREWIGSPAFELWTDLAGIDGDTVAARVLDRIADATDRRAEVLDAA